MRSDQRICFLRARIDRDSQELKQLQEKKRVEERRDHELRSELLGQLILEKRPDLVAELAGLISGRRGRDLFEGWEPPQAPSVSGDPADGCD